MALTIGICGGGIGGLSAAIALRKAGHNVQVFERAPAAKRVGADINLTPNAVFALDQLGVGPYLRESAARPTFRISRDGETGEETSRMPMSAAAEEKYGAPQLTLHRADLINALRSQLPSEAIAYDKHAVKLTSSDDNAILNFADCGSQEFDLVVGADGIHSVVRSALWGEDHPQYTGVVSYRGTFPNDRELGIPDTDAFTKWWGEIPEKQIVTFPLTQGKEIFVFATLPQENWSEEGWTLPGDVEDLRKAYANFHPDALKLLDALNDVTRSALHVREPMTRWAKASATLLGDAAHPMVPFMAQGACMAIEDAVVLSRALQCADRDSLKPALASYEAERKPRTAEIQRSSLANDWLKKGSNADWVYGYDAWTTKLNS
ncbi:MAG: FAD-dependent monooxygenase [Paracoccaceae bacterium]|nr:FAD-dependent monooxygenase [Paracoccaceae bacterium]MDG2257773.1 FAD-dependent monooxygenase [Paracoccaceae bacterium]